jgi:hypothetical protein
MVVSRKFSAPLLAAGLLTLAAGSAANADISDLVFHIRAETPDGRFAEFEHRFDAQYYDPERGFYEWNLTAPVNLMDADGNHIATLNTATEICNEDPDITLNFSVASGVVSTTFTITSAHLGFAAINNAEGRATASVNASDLSGDGVFMMPNGGSTYTAHYNGFVQAGTTFAPLLLAGAINPIPGSTASASEAFPPIGFVPIVPPVTDISSQFHFTLSPLDVAGGTSLFRVQPIPAPGAFALLGIAGLVAARRRR